MNEHLIGLADARIQLAELMGRVTYGGERIVLTRHGKPAAALVSIDDLARLGGQTSEPPESVGPPAPMLERISIAAGRGRVWQALTDPRDRERWWPAVDLDPEVGGRFLQLWSAAEDLPERAGGRITEFDDPQVFAVQWGDGGQTTVELVEESGGVQVVVTHTDGVCPVGWKLDLDALRRHVS